MENSESTINRVGRAMWTVWGYLTGAVGRYLRPEVTTEENQNVNCKQEDNKEEEGKDEIGGKVRVRDAAVQWEKGNVGADHGNDEEKVINKRGFARASCDSRLQERPKNVFLKASQNKDTDDDASTPRDDPLAYTDTELSKTEEDHQDGKGSKDSQEICSKPENEKEVVGNLFKELNASSPREDPLACTHTDIINKDDLSETEEDHLDEKGSKDSQEIGSEPENEKEDVENLFKELSASSPREDPLACTDTDIINKDDLSKTKEDHQDEKGSKASQAKSSKPEDEKEDVGNLFEELNASSPREDPLACTHTDIINKDDLSKTEEDHQDKKGSKASQAKSSKPEDEKEDVGNLFEELNASSPREDPLACTHTDIINKDDLSETEEDHLDEKESKNSQEICSEPENEREDVENLFKELSASSPREDPLACTHTDIINKDDLSKTEEDHQDEKGSKASQAKSSKPEDEKEDVGNLFEELNASSPREDPLACTHTDIINKDDLSETEEDHQDGKGSKASQEICSKPEDKKVDVENLFKELKDQGIKEGIGEKADIQKVPVEKTKENQGKTEEENEAIRSQMLEGSCLPSQLVISTKEMEDVSSKSLKIEVSDQKVENICKNLETPQMEHLEHQKTMEILENNDAKDSNLLTVDLSQSDPPIDTGSDISGPQRPKTETLVTEQDLTEALAKLKAGTGNQNDTLENRSEFETKADTEDVMKSSSRKQHLVSEMNQRYTETSQTDDGQINECSLQAPLSLKRDLTTLDLQSVGEIASSSLQELDRTDKIVEIMIDSTEEIDDTHTKVMHMCKKDMTTLKNEQMLNVTGDAKASVFEEMSEIPSDNQLNHGAFTLQDRSAVETEPHGLLTEFSEHLGSPLSNTEKETKEHKIIGETKLRFTDEHNAMHLSGEDLKNSELETTSRVQPMARREATTQEMDQSFPEQGSADHSSISLRQEDGTTVDIIDEMPSSLAPKFYITSETNETSVGEQDESGHESGTSLLIVETTELVEPKPLVFDDISKTLSEDGRAVRLQITTSDDLAFSETESALEVMEMQMDTDTDKHINEEGRTDSNETGSLPEGVVEKVMKTSEEYSKTVVVPQEDIHQSYPKKELPEQTTSSVSQMVVHPEPEDEIPDSTLHEQDETQWFNEATLGFITKLTPEMKISSTEQTFTTKHVRNDQNCQQEQSNKATTELAKDQTKTVDSTDTSETTPEDELNCSELAVTGLQIEALQPLSLPESESTEIWKDTHQDIETTEIELKTTSLEVVEESTDTEEIAVPEVICQPYTKEDSMLEQLPDQEVTKSLMQASFTKAKPVLPELKDVSPTSSMQELDKTECPDETSVGSTSMSKREQAESESKTKTESQISLEAVEITSEVPTKVVEVKAMILEDTSDTPLGEPTIQDRLAVETESHRPPKDMQMDTEMDTESDISGLIEGSDEDMKKAELETVVEEDVAQQEMSEPCYSEEKSPDMMVNELKCHLAEYRYHESSHESVENTLVLKESVTPSNLGECTALDRQQTEFLGPLNSPRSESALEALEILRDVKNEPEEQESTDGLRDKTNSAAASMGVVDELKVALKNKSKPNEKQILLSKTEGLEAKEMKVEVEASKRDDEKDECLTMYEEPKGETAVDGDKHLKERSRPGLKRGIKQMESSSRVFQLQQVFLLDLTAQKSKIAVRRPDIRPPKDPRMLINMPSVEPSTLPSRPSPLEKPFKEDASTPRKNIIGFKLPGLGAGLPVLRKTEAGKRIQDEKDTHVPPQKSNSESQPTDERVKQKPVPDKPEKPKWTPPKHPGIGSPMMMAELKNKLKKNVKE